MRRSKKYRDALLKVRLIFDPKVPASFKALAWAALNDELVEQVYGNDLLDKLGYHDVFGEKENETH